MKLRKSVSITTEFIVHVFVQTIIFMLLFIIILLMSFFAGWVEGLSRLPEFMISTLYNVEYLLFWVDISGFVVIILFEASMLVAQIYDLRPWK